MYKKRLSLRASCAGLNRNDAAAKVLPFQLPTAHSHAACGYDAGNPACAGGYSLFAGIYLRDAAVSKTNGVSTGQRILPVVSIDLAVCTLYLAGAQASGANIDVAGRTLHDRLDALDIGLPSTVGTTVRVRNLDTKRDALAADLAFCHSWHLLYRLVNKIYCNRNREKNQVLFSDS